MRERGGDNRVGEGWEVVMGNIKDVFLLPFYYIFITVLLRFLLPSVKYCICVCVQEFKSRKETF